MSGRGAHSRGIEALPSMDAYKSAYQATRYGSDRATRTIEQSRAASKNLEAAREQAMRDKYGKSNMLAKEISDRLNKSLNEFISGKRGEAKQQFGEQNADQGLTRSKIKQLARDGKTLYASQPSDCFASVSWDADDDSGEDGTCTLEFYRGGAVVYDVDMTLDEFLDFTSADSLGGYFNDFIR